MSNFLFKTTDSISQLIIRLTLGIVVFPHGAQKVLGWYGGPGYQGTIDAFQTQLGFPIPMVWLLMVIEFLGSIALILGFFTRLAALGIATSMSV